MSDGIPIISGNGAIKAFIKIGYIVVRQKGSHVRLLNDINSNRKPLTVPLHKELDKGLLRSLIRNAGISVEEFIKLL